MTETHYLDEHRLDSLQQALLEALSLLSKQQRAILGYNSIVSYLVNRIFKDETEEYRRDVVQKLGGRDKIHLIKEDHDTRKIMTVLWGLISDGILYPRFTTDNSSNHYVLSYFGVTERGDRVLDSLQSHPLSPSFIDHLKQQVKITDSVLANLEDASECLHRGLLRAAVVMIGLAVEETISVSIDALVHLNKMTPPPAWGWKASVQIAHLKTVVDTWISTPSTQKEEKLKMTMALSAFDGIRTVRNEAAHPGPVTLGRDSIESLLILASIQIPVMWQIPIAQAVNLGFALV